MVSPVMVERALVQTYEAGMDYAVVPAPWLLEQWYEWIQYNDTKVPWHELCWGLDCWSGNTLTSSKCVLNEDGDYLICLKRRDHEGACYG